MLYEHQKKIIEEDPLRCGLFLGTGGCKTRTALCLAEGNVLVVAPVTQYLDQNWHREVEKMKSEGDGHHLENITKLDVIKNNNCSKTGIVKIWDKLPYYDTLIVDESHESCGILPETRQKNKKPVPKKSQRLDAVKSYILKHKPKRIYFCTATPGQPIKIWAAAHMLGQKEKLGPLVDFFAFRDRFYFTRNVGGYPRYFLRGDTETVKLMGEITNRFSYTGTVFDFFDVPNQIYKTITVELTTAQKNRIKTIGQDYPDANIMYRKIHQIEQGILYNDEYTDDEIIKDNKIEAIERIVEEFPKVVLFVRYKGQIQKLKRHFEEDKKVFVLTGETKDRKKVIEDANTCDDCIFIAQSSISSGYELNTFSVVVFTSAPNRYLDLTQGKGRVLRGNALKKNIYINLTTRPYKFNKKTFSMDDIAWKGMELHQDFDNAIMNLIQ